MISVNIIPENGGILTILSLKSKELENNESHDFEFSRAGNPQLNWGPPYAFIHTFIEIEKEWSEVTINSFEQSGIIAH